MFTSHLLLAVAWIFYGILHSVLADRKVKQYIMRRTGPLSRYYRSFYNILALSLFALLILWLFSMETRNVWTPVFPQFIAGMMMFIPGIIGIVLILKKYFVTSQGFKDLFYEGGKPVLVTDGLHRFVRHPLYFSTFLFLWGLFLLLPLWSLLVTNTVVTIYTLIGIRLEEKKLVAIFGEQYINYRKSVPMIWPRIR